MANRVIQTRNAPAAIGPYSQATGTLQPDIKAQTAQSLQNIQAILKAAGLRKSDVVKTVVFLKNMDDFAAVNEIYADFFGDHKPARSCVEVARLPKGGLVEIEVIARA